MWLTKYRHQRKSQLTGCGEIQMSVDLLLEFVGSFSIDSSITFICARSESAGKRQQAMYMQ